MMPCSDSVILDLAKKKSRQAGEAMQDFSCSSKFDACLSAELLP